MASVAATLAAVGSPDDRERYARLEQRLVALGDEVHASLRLSFLAALAAGIGSVVVIAGLLQRVDRKRSKRASRRLHQLTLAGLRSHEKERLRVARDLHDGTFQVLVSTRWLLERALLPSVARVEPATPAIGEAIERLDLALREVRQASAALYPPQLDALGLAAALEAMASDADGLNGLRVRFRSAVGEQPFDPSISAILFRIAQEGLSNAQRHAGARTVDVILAASGRRLSMGIADDGRGFDPSALARAGKGAGLRAMRDRIEALGGHFRLRTVPGKGCRLSFALPLGLALGRRDAVTPASPGRGRPSTLARVSRSPVPSFDRGGPTCIGPRRP